MTSNIGARIIETSTPLVFQRSEGIEVYDKIKENVMTELRKAFNRNF